LILEINVTAVPIVPRICRGRLYFEVTNALLPAFTEAAAALPAEGTRRLAIIEKAAGPALTPSNGGGA
jgi:hypothetical protein